VPSLVAQALSQCFTHKGLALNITPPLPSLRRKMRGLRLKLAISQVCSLCHMLFPSLSSARDSEVRFTVALHRGVVGTRVRVGGPRLGLAEFSDP
jgi:hypothetical protein